MSVVLVSGAHTPFGAKLIKMALKMESFSKIYALIPREMFEQNSHQTIIDFIGEQSLRCTFLFCDSGIKHFGLNEDEWQLLSTEVSIGFCLDDNDSPLLSHEENEKYNLNSVEPWLELLQCNDSLSLHYLSSIFCQSNNTTNLITEFEFGEKKKCFNRYEKSKQAAERLINASQCRHRISIYRKSFVFGKSSDNCIINFLSTIYTLIHYLADNRPRFLVCDPKMLLDTVTLDYVVDAMLALSTLETKQKQSDYHLVNGYQHAYSLEKVIDIVCGGCHTKKPIYLPPLFRYLMTFCSAGPSPNKLSQKAYVSYLISPLHYDALRTKKILSTAGIECPKPSTYLETCINAAIA